MTLQETTWGARRVADDGVHGRRVRARARCGGASAKCTSVLMNHVAPTLGEHRAPPSADEAGWFQMASAPNAPSLTWDPREDSLWA